MCTPILADPESARKAHPQFVVDLPRCLSDNTPLAWSSTLRRLTCPTCGWRRVLGPAEAHDLTDALLGLAPDLRLDLFVQALAD